VTRETAATASGSQPLGTHAPAVRSVMAGVCVLEGEVLSRNAAMGLGRSGAPGRGPRRAGSCSRP